MTILYHTLTAANIADVQSGRDEIQVCLSKTSCNKVIAEAETQLLIDNLKDRGYQAFTNEEVREFEETMDEAEEAIEGGEMLSDLATGLLGALKQQNSELTLKLMEAIIYGATGEKVELKAVNGVEAA